MVLLIKNKIASVEGVAHPSLSPAGRVTKRCTQSPRNAGVPRAKSSPHVNFVADARSLKARCAAVVHGDLHKSKPTDPFVRQVKSAKKDLRASPKHQVETARRPGGSIPVEPTNLATASTVGSSSPMNPSSSPVVSDLACSDQQEEEDHLRCLLAVAQSWLDFERLFPQRRADTVQPIEQARRDFCDALVQSFSGCSSTTSSIQADQRSGNLADMSPLSIPPSHLSSRAPSATSSTGQTTVASTVSAKPQPTRSLEFSNEESRRESDNFSFRFSEEEEWTPEVESRMQDAIDRLLSDAMRQLAIPVPNFSVQFPDDFLADSVAHQTVANPRTSRSGASSLEDYNSSYLADRKDEVEEDDGLVSLSPAPSSPACSVTLVVDAVTIPVPAVQLLPSSQMDLRTSNKVQDDVKSMVMDIGYGVDDVWEELPTYVPRLVTRLSEEELLADEFVVEADSRSPLSTHGDTIEVGSTPASTSLDTVIPLVATAGKTPRQMRRFVDLENPVSLLTLQSTSSIKTLCETISVYEEDCQDRRIQRVSGCIDLRKTFGGSDGSIETSRSLSMVSEERSHSSLGGCCSFEERQCLLDLEEGPKVQTMTKSPAKPPILPIPPKPPDIHLRQKSQFLSAMIQESSTPSSHCDPSSSLLLWSCAKITRSKGKWGLPLNGWSKVLKQRIDSVPTDAEIVLDRPP